MGLARAEVSQQVRRIVCRSRIPENDLGGRSGPVETSDVDSVEVLADIEDPEHTIHDAHVIDVVQFDTCKIAWSIIVQTVMAVHRELGEACKPDHVSDCQRSKIREKVDPRSHNADVQVRRRTGPQALSRQVALFRGQPTESQILDVPERAVMLEI